MSVLFIWERNNYCSFFLLFLMLSWNSCIYPSICIFFCIWTCNHLNLIHVFDSPFLGHIFKGIYSGTEMWESMIKINLQMLSAIDLCLVWNNFTVGRDDFLYAQFWGRATAVIWRYFILSWVSHFLKMCWRKINRATVQVQREVLFKRHFGGDTEINICNAVW